MRRVFGLILLAVSPVIGPATRCSAMPPFVPGQVRAESAPELQSKVGWLLINELQCGACHTLPAQAARGLPARVAPRLDGVGTRLHREYIARFVEEPHEVEAGTRMPRMLGGKSPRERRSIATAIAAALCGEQRPAVRAPSRKRVQEGRRLFHRVGCVACHGPQEASATAFPASVPLPELVKKYTIPSLATFLQDPLAVRPSGRMPHLSLSKDESLAIATYLLRGVKVEAAIRFRYYEGSWQTLPDFDKLNPRDSGVASEFDLGFRARDDEFGFSFESYLRIVKAGEYQFHLGSDDGSQLWIDGQSIAKPDGVHPLTWQSGKTHLTVGVHRVRVDFFEYHGGEELRVEWEGPGLKRTALAPYLVATPDEKPRNESRSVAEQLVTQGRQFLQQLRCAACHEIKGLAPPAKLPLDVAMLDEGCLSASVSGGVPDFELSGEQRVAIQRALAGDKAATAKTESAADAVWNMLLAMNCLACHERGGIGGVAPDQFEWFVGNQPEMGDEGRIPPSLSGVGAKLRSEWLDELWEKGTHERFYMETRMPRFGRANVGELTRLLAEADHRSFSVLPHSGDIPARRLKAGGRFLAGSKGFSCIKCHRFAKFEATGIQAISMTSMTKRLKSDWFHAYMLDPAAFRPGTRMPAAWPGGQILLPKVLDGTAGTQIHALWVFLSDGDRAAPPEGLGRAPIELVAKTVPVLYRNFIEGAGPRAIGVGYPEHVNLAFDANQLRLALLWHGAFIDASRHWIGRGQGFQRPLGDNILSLTDAVPFARLANADAAWPTKSARELAGYQFRGYRLDDQLRPTFLYDAAGVHVQEYYRPDGEEQYAPLTRVVTVTSEQPLDGVWFLAATGDSIERDAAGRYVVDRSWKTALESARTPVIRESNGRYELLVPLAGSGTVVVKQRFEW